MPIKGINLLFQSKRSSLTCTYKCGNACAGDCTNESDNPYFGDLMSRRGVLKAFGAGTVTLGGGALLAACGVDEDVAETTESATATSTSTEVAKAEIKPAAGMRFDGVQPNEKDEVVVPAGYDTSVLIAWGDPVYEDAPEFDPNNQTAAAAARQFGFNNDFAGLMEHPTDKNRMLYVCSHEYSTEPRFSGVLVGADIEHAVLVGRVLHQAGEVVVEAELAGCSCGGLVVRVELRRVLVHRVAPGDQHRGVVARRDDNLVLLVRLHAVETHASSRLDLSLRDLGAGGGGRRGFGGFRHILVDAAGGEQCAAAEGHGASAECLQHAAAGHQVAEVRVVGLVGAIASTRVAALVGTGQRRALGLEQQVNTLDRHEFSRET